MFDLIGIVGSVKPNLACCECALWRATGGV
jgi:hypothetical protein